MLPHQHHEELNDIEHNEEHASADNLIEYLQLIFHIDLGDEHLESFENGKSFDLALELTVDLFPDLVTHLFYSPIQKSSTYQSSLSYFNHGIPILKKDVIAHLDFRGPPTIV